MLINEFLKTINYINQEVKIVCTDGEVIFGRIINYVSALDNEPDGEAVDILQTRHAESRGISIEIETGEIAEITLV